MANSSKVRKAQAGLEYMLNYGWAALVMVIVIVLLFVFLGASGNAPFTQTGCIPGTDYSCTSPVLNTSGYLSIAFSHGGGPYEITAFGCSATANATGVTYMIPQNPLDLPPSQAITALFKCPVAPAGATSVPIGTPFSGYLWVRYNTTTATDITTNIGLVQLKVSTGNPLPATQGERVEIMGCGSNPVITYFVSNNVTLFSNANIYLPPGNALYICGIGMGPGTIPPSVINWTTDVAAEYSSPPPDAVIGRLGNGESTCTAKTPSGVSAMSGIAVRCVPDGIITNFTTNNALLVAPMPFPPVYANYTLMQRSLVIIVATAGGGSTPSLSLPSNCSVVNQQSISYGGNEAGSMIATCREGAGHYVLSGRSNPNYGCSPECATSPIALATYILPENT